MTRPISLRLQGEPPVSTRPVSHALWAKGFRPFFLLAAAWATLSVPLWLLTLADVVHPGGYLGAMSWHAHEMVFGFAAAVVAGFLLTAAGNWTGRETLTGGPLLLLGGVWVLGRLAMTCPPRLAPWMLAVADLAFLPLLTAVVARPLLAARNRRNYGMIVVLLALFATNLTTHLDVLGVLPGWRRQGSLVGVDVITLLIVLIGGRVIPLFTRNATGATDIRSVPSLDVLAAVTMALLIVAEIGFAGSRLVAVLAGAAGLATAVRALPWGTRHVGRTPLLWVLHAGYAWVPLGLLLRAASSFWPSIVSPSVATHALTAGAIGTLTLGMMVRVTLGHTGRPLAITGPVTVAFVAVTAAALVRVVGPLVAPGAYRAVIDLAGSLWCVAFALFLAVYAPALASPRVDGKPG